MRWLCLLIQSVMCLLIQSVMCLLAATSLYHDQAYQHPHVQASSDRQSQMALSQNQLYFCKLISLMTPSLILAILAAIVLADTTDNNNIQSIYINTTACTLTYYAPPANFSFLGCTAQTSNSNDWSDCVSLCCQNDKSIDSNTPSLLGIVECRNGQGDSGSSVAVIVMGVLIGAFGLIVILCFCMVTCRIVGSYQLRNRMISNSEVVNQVQWPQQKQITNSITSLKWSKQASQLSPLRKVDTPCSICLDQRTNAELVCRHQYHAGCVGKWFNKSSACPCCRHENIRSVKVYCQVCKWRYIVASDRFLINNGADLVLVCDECRVRQGVGSEQINVMPKQSAQVLQQVSHQNLMEIQTFVFGQEQLQ